MSLAGKVVLLTGGSMGIGEAIANSLAQNGAKIMLFSRSEERLRLVAQKIRDTYNTTVSYRAVNVGDYIAVDSAVDSTVEELGKIDIVVNNAGLALGAPSSFAQLSLSSIMTMNDTNINGYMYVTHSVLNRSMLPNGKTGTILNITSVTALEPPPFPGEVVYHANKAAQEAFTNALRNELSETNIRVLSLRPGVVATNFHEQRVGYNKELYDQFIEGYEPLIATDIAESTIYILNQPERISIKSLDIVPSAQRSLSVFDKKWIERNRST